MTKKKILEKTEGKYTVAFYKSMPNKSGNVRYQYIFVDGENVLQTSKWMKKEDFFAMIKLLFLGFADIISAQVERRKNNAPETPNKGS